MENQHSRTETLIGKDALEKLSSSRVAIFGVGGVGGYVAEALARTGVGIIDLIDKDAVGVTNINRQIYDLHSTVGRDKVIVAKERILDINPNIVVNTYKTFFSSENSEDFDFSEYDYIVDAIDTVSSKLELVMKAQQCSVPIISSMGAGNKLNPEMFEIADIYKTSVCPLAKVMRQELKKRGIKKLKVVYSKEAPIKKEGQRLPASIAFVPPVVGLIISSVVVKDLIL